MANAVSPLALACRIPPVLGFRHCAQRQAAQRGNIFAQQQSAQRHHPEAKYRQEPKHAASDQAYAQWQAQPPGFPPDQPGVGPARTMWQCIEQAHQARIIAIGGPIHRDYSGMAGLGTVRLERRRPAASWLRNSTPAEKTMAA